MKLCKFCLGTSTILIIIKTHENLTKRMLNLRKKPFKFGKTHRVHLIVSGHGIVSLYSLRIALRESRPLL